jgi:hypothetical protein
MLHRKPALQARAVLGQPETRHGRSTTATPQQRKVRRAAANWRFVPEAAVSSCGKVCLQYTHRITLSVRTRSDGGMGRISAFAAAWGSPRGGDT